MNETPAECQKCQDTNPDITWHTRGAGLPGVVSSFHRAERARLSVCFPSKDGCSWLDLGEACWLRGRWCHSVLPAAAEAWRVAPTPRPQRGAVVESQCVWASGPKCHCGWGSKGKKPHIPHSKWVGREPMGLWSRSMSPPWPSGVWPISRPRLKCLLCPSGLHRTAEVFLEMVKSS